MADIYFLSAHGEQLLYKLNDEDRKEFDEAHIKTYDENIKQISKTLEGIKPDQYVHMESMSNSISHPLRCIIQSRDTNRSLLSLESFVKYRRRSRISKREKQSDTTRLKLQII